MGLVNILLVWLGQSTWTKKKWFECVIDCLCDIDLSPHQVTLIFDFQGQILNKPYLRNDKADWQQTQRIWVHWMWDTFCDLELCPLIFPTALKSRIPWMGWPMDIERKDVDRLAVRRPILWPWAITLNFGSQSRFWQNPYPRNGMAAWHGTKAVPLCWLWTLTSPITLILEYNFIFWWNYISGLWRSIDMELKGYESTRCWTLLMSLSLVPWPLDYSSSYCEKKLSQELDGQLTWDERDVNS